MRDIPSISVAPAPPPVFPLDAFYSRAQLPLPDIQALPAEELPEPFRALLAHNNDMTPTLEGFHHADIHLRILGRWQRDDFYFREVVLCLDDTDQPVEFGANRVSLALFPEAARKLILQEHVPLGRILRDCGIQHRTAAKAFFRLQADDLICRSLCLSRPMLLYGRRATISDPHDRPLSEVVEILPPVASNQRSMPSDGI